MRGVVGMICFLMALTSESGAQDAALLPGSIDSIYEGMSVEERVGQLFMIRAHSNLGPEHVSSVKKQIEKYHVGGLCFFQGTPGEHAELINSYQQLSGTPLLVAMDAEWGGGMRFKESGMSFPHQLMLGAIQESTLLYDMGVEVGRQLLSIGINVNFAPVVDININPKNPVINDRSFGEGMYNVTAKSYQYMRGMQDAGIMACAKHFPGHGDTDVDSHLDLPVIEHSLQRMDSVELYPFKTLIDKGIQSVMVAHLHVPSMDDTPNLPTTLSPWVVDTLLRQQLGFDGLVFTDALEMKGVTKHFRPGEVEVKAVIAGNDVLCLPADINIAFPAVMSAVHAGVITEDRLEESVKRILKAKLQLGLFNRDSANVNADFFPAEGLALKGELIENAITVVANEGDLIPIRKIQKVSIACLNIGSAKTTPFQERLTSYADVKNISVTQEQLGQRKKGLIDLLSSDDIVIVALTGMDKLVQRDFGLSAGTRAFIKQFSAKSQVILVIFGSPYSLKFFEDIPHVILAYQDDPMVQDITAQALFGAFSIRGRLPVTASARFPVNHGLQLRSLGRLGYSLPERVHMSGDSLDKIAGIVDEMIAKRAAPGCQVLVVKEGKVVYSKAFGHFTYDGKRAVKMDDLYDVASVTKVAATTVAAMKLYEQGAFLPRQTLDYYLDDVRDTNKEHLVIRDLMSHQAGLQPWIPFYDATMSKTRSGSAPSKEFYRHNREKDFTVHVAKGLYMRDSQVDSIWLRILESEVRMNRGYRYSDLGFYIVAEIIERQIRNSLDVFCTDTFYEPLGMTRTCFKPLDRFKVDEIAPTEEDRAYRKQRLQGFVHDAGSAMLGGVGGHAGLFSNAEGLAKLMQMLLNGGSYGGKQYLDPKSIAKFAHRVPNSTRRGLGFDMKELNPNREIHTSGLASDGTYGHTGFTGTCVWNDPENDMIFVFLSNRTYPSSRNNKLNKLEIRERIHTLIYRSMGS
jgi:beta-N-acetylhexosaminidase